LGIAGIGNRYYFGGVVFPRSKDTNLPEEQVRLKIADQMRGALHKILTTPITFYGKVVDQDGKPIPGVKVPASMATFAEAPLMFFTGSKNYKTTTDQDGRFVFNGAGKSILIGILKKDGYAFNRSEVKEDKFYYAKEDNENISLHKPDINNPVVFQMRKKEKSEFVLVRGIEEDCSETLSNSKNFAYFNMYYPEINPKKKFFSYYKTKPYNFTFEVKTSPIQSDTQTLTLTMKAAKGISFQVVNREVYVAPKDGYNLQEKSFTFRRKIAYKTRNFLGIGDKPQHETVLVNKWVEYKRNDNESVIDDYVPVEDLKKDDGNGVPFKFVVKDDIHNVYSKLNLYLIPFLGRRENINVELTSVTNPYGNRTLEIDQETQDKMKPKELKKLTKKLGVKTDQDISDEWHAKCQREREEEESKWGEDL
jgi:hypothetical protein